MATPVAVITGAASGIGAGLARCAVERGMAVVLADWNIEQLEVTSRELSGEVAILKVDVRNEEHLERLSQFAYDTFGRVDLLFNNAGVLSSGQVWELDAETWRRSFDINVFGIVNGLRAFVPKLLESGIPARIINTASVGGFFSGPLMGPYSASKAAVVSLTEALAIELHKLNCNISVSLLVPGPVKTSILDGEPTTHSSNLIKKMKLMTSDRGADPDQFATLIFDAIDRGDYWIVPQPEALDSRLIKRTEMIIGREPPTGV
ncbi:SDR family oxidoreductase [Parafrankia sp. BMG5.11]|uniref:SDR family NAD(P)-dependent oxidoreductase n=1 Tax=Parafrankia sp. BMG5.11 TaxID=222540 RepID=UPI00103966E2|nr:SDR family NAD(P)-dependent oxidoreductase [Parafrankia sp. BMG5.11]TCJ39102.1 SDR family NAD(P)-dependent oxidoreductase [Parafrankia sp. BMG5.11]